MEKKEFPGCNQKIKKFRRSDDFKYLWRLRSGLSEVLRAWLTFDFFIAKKEIFDMNKKIYLTATLFNFVTNVIHNNQKSSFDHM